MFTTNNFAIVTLHRYRKIKVKLGHTA